MLIISMYANHYLCQLCVMRQILSLFSICVEFSENQAIMPQSSHQHHLFLSLTVSKCTVLSDVVSIHQIVLHDYADIKCK